MATPPSLDAARRQVAETLQATLSPEGQIRQQAEIALARAETQPNYLLALFSLISNADHPPPSPSISPQDMVAIRQSGGVCLKNLIRRRWAFSEDNPPPQPPPAAPERSTSHFFSADEKHVIRQSFLEALARSEPLVSSQLAEAMKMIVITDFPHHWPNLVPEIMQNLSSAENARQVAALTALRNVAKVFEFRPHEQETNPLHELVTVCFPLLQQTLVALEDQIASMHSGTISANDSVHHKQKLICKIVWSSTQYILPPFLLQNPGHFREWMRLFANILTRPVAVMETTNADELLKVPAWKVKKWIGHIMHRIFQRYGDPKNVDRPELASFAQTFQMDYAGTIAQGMLQVLSWPSQGLQLSSRVANLSINYLEASISPAATWKALVVHIDKLLTQILFPYLCISEEDLQLWTEDPVEYVRKTYDILEDFYSPRAAAASMIYTLSKLRAKNTVMPFLDFCVNVLNAYAALPNDADQKRELAKQKDGALMVIGQVKDKLLSKPELKSQMAAMVRAHVFPEFDSPFAFLRARACWVLGQLASQPETFVPTTLTGPNEDDFFSDPTLLHSALQAVLKCLQDQEFPVRVQAAVDVRHFLGNSMSHELIKPLLGPLLDQLFNLIDEVDSTDIVATIEEIVDRFSVEILPHSITLTKKLTTAFLRAASVSDDEEEASMAAVQCLHAIDSIVLALATNNPTEADNMCKALELILEPILCDMFEDTRMEFFEECLDVLSSLIYYQKPPLSQFLWSLFEKMIASFHSWADEYVENMVPPIDNYISRGTEQFLNGIGQNGISYRQMILQSIFHVWAKRDAGDSESVEGAKIAEAYLLNCRGHVDDSIPAIVEAALRRLRSCETAKLRTMLITTVAHACFCNPALAVQSLETHGATQEFLGLWMQTSSSLVRVHDKKATVVALSSILSLPSDSVPHPVVGACPAMLLTAANLVRQIREQRQKRAEDTEGHDTQGVSVIPTYPDFGDRGSDVADDEDVEDDFEKSLVRSYMNQHADDDDMNEMEDKGEFETPLDAIDELVVFANVVASGGTSCVQHGLNALSMQDQQTLQAIVTEASQGQAATNL